MPKLPDSARRLFEALPLDRAMPLLIPREPQSAPVLKLAEEVASDLEGSPALQAAVWLYVDELDRSHRISQRMDSPLGGYWHAIMHRRQGDFSNSRYWLRSVGKSIPLPEGLEALQLLDRIERAPSVDDGALLGEQRREWKALFNFSQSAETGAQ